jgi:hypothetical protein
LIISPITGKLEAILVGVGNILAACVLTPPVPIDAPIDDVLVLVPVPTDAPIVTTGVVEVTPIFVPNVVPLISVKLIPPTPLK